jgi:hypothetical protein
MTREISVHDPARDNRIDAAALGDDPPSARRPLRPSDMRALHVWQPPNMPSRYRVDFFNTFARGRTNRRVCQRSIIVQRACCAEEAREIAEARFAEIEGVRNWHIHAAEIEIVPIIDADRAGGGDTPRSEPAPCSHPEPAR